MRQAYRVIAGLIALGVLVQAAAVAMGWFMVISDSEEADVIINSDYDGNIGHAIHGIVGFNVMPLLGLILLIVSFFAKFPGAIKWAGLTLLAIVVQVVLGLISFSIGGLGALHGLNAFVVFGVAAYTARRAALAEDATIRRAETATV
jgi:hypothetical protein